MAGVMVENGALLARAALLPEAPRQMVPISGR